MASLLAPENRQKLMLYGVGVIGVAIVVIFFGDRLLPKPIGGDLPEATRSRIEIPPGIGTALYQREDFKALRRFADVPVKPVRAGGSTAPFQTEP